MNPLFDRAMDYVLKNEGGYVWDQDDAGGPTNFGITQHDLAAWRAIPVAPSDVKDMSIEEAKAIYFSWYWKPLGLEDINPLPIATCLMDAGVLYGLFISATFAQRSINTMGGALIVDGHIGPAAAAALNSVDVKTFVKTYVANIQARINDVVYTHPRDQKFRAGWEARMNRLLTLA